LVRDNSDDAQTETTEYPKPENLRPGAIVHSNATVRRDGGVSARVIQYEARKLP
jgi:hypothetical protein